MLLTDSVVVMQDYVLQKLKDNQASLGLQDVWRGDQQKLPRTPCAAVEAGPKVRMLEGAMRYTKVNLTCYVLIYWGAIRDVQLNTADADTLAEAVETLLHSDNTLGAFPNQLVIDSMVTGIDPGYSNKGGTLYRGARITFEATSKVLLPNNLGS